MSYLKNCPFCGSDDLDPEFWLTDNVRTGPGCNRCGATAENIEKWNTRALDTELTRYKEALEFMFETAGLGAELYPITKMSPEDYAGLSETHYQFKNCAAKTALEAVEAVMKQERPTGQ